MSAAEPAVNRESNLHYPLSGITVLDLSHVYNGPYALAHTLIEDKPVTSNGQVSMRLSRLRALNATVPEAERVPSR